VSKYDMRNTGFFFLVEREKRGR